MSEINDNIDEFDLFDEEFDKEDVINSDLDDLPEDFEEDDQISEFRTGDALGQRIDVRELINKKTLEPEDFLNYDDELRKKKDFSLEYNQSKEVIEKEKRLQENFKDFLIARNITGKKSFSQYKSRLPADILIDSGRTVQLEDDQEIAEKHEDEAAKIVINRNENDEIENIEVYCACGRKTKIEFDYDNYAKDDIEKTKDESILDYDRYRDHKEEMDIEFENKKELLKQKNMKEEDKKRIRKNVPKTQMYDNPDIDEMEDVIESGTSKNVVDSEDIISESNQSVEDSQRQIAETMEQLENATDIIDDPDQGDELKDQIDHVEKDDTRDESFDQDPDPETSDT